MTGEINRVPAGLLSILDMKARGQNPRLLSSQVDGSIDLLDLYLGQQRETVSGTATPAAVGFVSTSQVPNDQYWYVHHIAGTSGALAAATSYRCGLCIRRNNTAGSIQLMPFGELRSFTTGEQVGLGVEFPKPMLLRPGDLIGVYWAGITLGVAAGVVVGSEITRVPS